MLDAWMVLLVSLLYLGLLFAIASYADRRAERGQSLIDNPYVYTLSLGVYCTAWTFYGSVGLAASSGLGFLPVYLGPTLMACLWWIVLRKMLRITKAQGISSIADFIAARYGKSTLLGGVVTVIAVTGIIPYIALQLKAVSSSVTVVLTEPSVGMPTPFGADTALMVALVLAAFAILFGTRHVDATEHHAGMVAAIAFESVVKLVAFLTVGVFVVYGVHGGFNALLNEAISAGHGAVLTFAGSGLGAADWFWLMAISGLAILFLPRQFQVAVIENVREDHVRKAIWLFPLYLLAINIFVMPIALAGLLAFPDRSVDADTFVLALPMAEGRAWLVLLTFLGGLSAATAMVIVATIALSTMVSNDLIMPVLLRVRQLRLNERADLTGLVLAIRRGSILAILLLGYAYFRGVGEAYQLVSIGLTSFAAVAQFAPPILCGLFWKDASGVGAMTGLLAGFAFWFYTLLVPSLAVTGWIDAGILDAGPWGIALLRPHALFGLEGLHPVTHAVIWSLAANLTCLVVVSIFHTPGRLERLQAALFVDVFKRESRLDAWRGRATVGDLRVLLARFVGAAAADRLFAGHAARTGMRLAPKDDAGPELVQMTERQLAGAIGASSARVMVSTVVQGEALGPDEVLEILDEASQVREYSRQLEQKSRALEEASEELRRANRRLTELDHLKDEFLSTVSHELRTPLTSIRSFSEILRDTPDLSADERSRFLEVLVKESERLSRLIDDVLDVSRIEAGKMEWHVVRFSINDVVEDALAATGGLFHDRSVAVECVLAQGLADVVADRDRVMQVVINLLSNAAKFAPTGDGHVVVTTAADDDGVVVSVRDNGPGIPAADFETVFEKFRQVGTTLTNKPRGTGLGLTICRRIVEHFGGRIWAEAATPNGAVLCFRLPLESEHAVGQPVEAAAE